MTGVLLFFAIVVVIFVFDMWLDRKFPCSCGRVRTWYYMAEHERAGVMVGRALWNTGLTVFALANMSWIAGPVLALLACYTWRRWWFHEKDKLKKKAAKAAGVVGFNSHGRLVVKTVDTR